MAGRNSAAAPVSHTSSTSARSRSLIVGASAAKAVLYGDYSGLSVNIREDISIEVLREKYATQHAIGVVAWLEMDSKITDAQKLAVLTMKAS